MLTKQRLQLMTSLADFKQTHKKTALRVTRYYRNDYIAVQLLKNFFITSIAYVILLGLFAVYHLDFILGNLNDLRLGRLLFVLGVVYFVMLAVTSVITYVIARIRYLRAAEETKEFDQKLELLENIYQQERQISENPFEEDTGLWEN
jgi:predicted PurR-regulated permease PerM